MSTQIRLFEGIDLLLLLFLADPHRHPRHLGHLRGHCGRHVVVRQCLSHQKYQLLCLVGCGLRQVLDIFLREGDLEFLQDLV